MGTSAFVGSIQSSFWFFGNVIFRWVPASITALVNAVQSSSAPTEPISAWSVPALLSGTQPNPLYDSIAHTWITLSIFSFVVSAFFLGIIVFAMVRVWQIRREERRAVEHAQQSVVAEDVSKTKLRWTRIMEQIAGDKPDGWRLAILEADIMLNEILDLRGYRGETMADKMKQVDRADFNTIDLAWDAHKYRNRIAHETSDIALEYREVRRIIGLYERVFREFGFVE